jgi:hypothetical protein
MPTRHPETANNVGLIVTRKCHKTGTLVSLYRSNEAGMESDPDLPYSTVCETHATLVCHETQALARIHLSHPDGWCEECRAAIAAAKEALTTGNR